MRYIALSFFLFLWTFSVVPTAGYSAQKPEDIDPCALISLEKMTSVFQQLQRAEKQQVGPSTVCNYLDKFDIPALIISVSQAGPHARDTLTMLGSGYTIEDLPDLGDEAAIAIQQENPAFGLKEGIAALNIKKGDLSLNLSFTRLSIKPQGPDLESVKNLATEMVSNL